MLERLLRRLVGEEVEIAVPGSVFRGTVTSVQGGFVRFAETALPTYGGPELLFIPISQLYFIRVLQER